MVNHGHAGQAAVQMGQPWGSFSVVGAADRWAVGGGHRIRARGWSWRDDLEQLAFVKVKTFGVCV